MSRAHTRIHGATYVGHPLSAGAARWTVDPDEVINAIKPFVAE